MSVKSHRKTYVVTDIELNLLRDIQYKAMEKKYKTSDSEIIRLGIKLVSELSVEKLAKALLSINSLKKGRPIK